MNLEIIIPVYNGSKFLPECLKSIGENQIPNLKSVLLVNNNSSDNSVAIAKSIRLFCPIRLINLSSNVGFGRAVNIGMAELARRNTELGLVINQDTVLNEQCLSSIIAVAGILRDPRFVLAPVQLSWDGNKIDKVQNRFFERKKLLPLPTSGFRSIPFLTGAAFAVNPQLYEELGGFDEHFFMYGEDSDLFRRAILGGFTFYIVFDSKLKHKHTAINEFVKYKPMNRYGAELCRLKNINTSFTSCLIEFACRAIFVTLSAVPYGKGLSTLMIFISLARILPSIYVRRKNDIAKALILKYRQNHTDPKGI
jgi:GT2 family glycosyltransferase